MKGKKVEEYKYCVCQDFGGSFINVFFLPSLHISLGHPITSSVPSVTEIFVRKVKITKKVVYVAYFLTRDLSSVPLKNVKLQ